MNSLLFGKTLLVGRSPKGGRLCVVVDDNVKPAVALSGNPGSVPNTVSRYDNVEHIAHCKIDISPAGAMMLHNMKSSNRTSVNGIEVQSKKIKEGAVISLGKDDYQINVDTILNCALVALNGIIGGSGDNNGSENGGKGGSDNTSAISISHLENIWTQYKSSKAELKKRQKKIMLIKSAYMPIVVLSGIFGYLIDFFEWGKSVSQAISIVMYVIAAIFLFYGFYKTFTDKTSEESEALDENFRRKYVCPQCRRFLGYVPIDEIKLNSKCLYCKANWK